MNDTKPWYASIGAWGSIIAAICGALALVRNIQINPADQQDAATQCAALGAAISGVVALIGRLRAKKTIGANGTGSALILMALLPLLHGCQASAGFAGGVHNTGPTFSKEVRFYAERDVSIDTATRAQYLALADEFDAAISAKPITLDSVRDVWNRLKPVYTAYIDADDRLSPTEKARRAHNVSRIDTLINAEGKRWIYPQTQ